MKSDPANNPEGKRILHKNAIQSNSICCTLCSSCSETHFKSKTHLILHKVIKDRWVQLSNAVYHNRQINTLHLDLGLAPPCCWVLFFHRWPLLNLKSRCISAYIHYIITHTCIDMNWLYCWGCFHRPVPPPDLVLPGPPAFWPDRTNMPLFHLRQIS